jgi:hypothetical protein
MVVLSQKKIHEIKYFIRNNPNLSVEQVADYFKLPNKVIFDFCIIIKKNGR